MYLIAKLQNGKKAFPLTPGNRWTVGRGFDRSIFLVDNRISRNHAILERFALGFRLKDHSKNGTWVNGIKMEPGFMLELSGRETIRFGSIECYFSSVMPKECQPILNTKETEL